MVIFRKCQPRTKNQLLKILMVISIIIWIQEFFNEIFFIVLISNIGGVEPGRRFCFSEYSCFVVITIKLISKIVVA